MDALALRALVLETNLGVHGVPATVTRPWPDDTPIETSGIWVAADTQRAITDPMPASADLQRRDLERVIALPVSEVPTVPIDSRIVATERHGEVAKTWRVVDHEYVEAEHRRVVVVPETEP